MKLDAQGRAHVAYWDTGDFKLHYAVSIAPGLWRFSTVAHIGMLDFEYRSIDMLVDPLGRPVILFCDKYAGDLKLATLDASWTIETVDPAQSNGRAVALAQDSQGELHVAYGDLSDRGVYHAQRSGGGWQTERIGTFKDFKPFVAVAVDPADEPRVAFPAQAGPVVVSRQAGTWDEELVDACQECDPKGMQIEVDAAGDLHVLYEELHWENLVYARRAAGRWVMFNVAHELNIYGRTSLALDAAGQPAIALVMENLGRIDLLRW
jgi:hypothetical protein